MRRKRSISPVDAEGPILAVVPPHTSILAAPLFRQVFAHMGFVEVGRRAERIIGATASDTRRYSETSVYHATDVPIVLSGDTIVFLDPHVKKCYPGGIADVN